MCYLLIRIGPLRVKYIVQTLNLFCLQSRFKLDSATFLWFTNIFDRLYYKYYNKKTDIDFQHWNPKSVYSPIRTFPHKTQFFCFDLCHMKKLPDNYLVNAVKLRFFIFSESFWNILLNGSHTQRTHCFATTTVRPTSIYSKEYFFLFFFPPYTTLLSFEVFTYYRHQTKERVLLLSLGHKKNA